MTASVKELQRIYRVADMLCSAHARLRDRYTRWGLWIELVVLGLSLWLVALAFVEPTINVSLTPRWFEPRIWVGVLGTSTFFLTLFQLRTDWRGRADAHKRSFAMYAGVKDECGQLLSTSSEITPQAFAQLRARYGLAARLGEEISEREFLRQKRHHRVKVAVSRHLDTHPAASILLTRLRFIVRDNLSGRPHEPER